MAFNHLLNLSMAFHTKRKTGEVLRILDRGAAINNFFQVRSQKQFSGPSRAHVLSSRILLLQYFLFSLLPVFVDIGVAMIYLGRTFSAGIGVVLFIVMLL